MGFKIGDRVRFKPQYAVPGYSAGTVTAVGGLGSVDLWATIAFDGVDDGGRWMTWALEPALLPPRGPKPLTLTGGRPRFTVRPAWATRPPLYAHLVEYR